MNRDLQDAMRGPESFLVLSAHDYRSPRKANIHFITEQLAKRGPTRFFSLRYSLLSRYTADPRLPIDGCANRIERHRGVDCFLWKTQVHPFNTRRPLLRPVEALMFGWYLRAASPVLLRWIAEASVILFESGTAPVFFELARRMNPAAKTVYIASDDLDTINSADYVKRTFLRIAPSIDIIRLPSRALARTIPSSGNLYFIPHGIDPGLASQGDPSPYGPGIHAVSVGSMLFDAEFFACASRRFPHISFHVIGSGRPRCADYGSNVIVHDEMPHADTVRFIKHAHFGIAPYRTAQLPDYLADTSMKLIQYDFLGLPAVCPREVVGDYRSRFGYRPSDEESIVAAIKAALEAPREPSRAHPSWSDVADRVLQPTRYSDTRIRT
ncbi:glycosyltransferase [Aromatoleum buckelii]|uniref:Glycosyltransferase family 1 protein n=1 Tax=Aromatoleum buckelii TaxID=200254 RepID=A0ABX1N0F9_9RHOO|nr:glycosyltransferase [Aromatoleum buckelii]MCK0512963.1 glycosyltransferase [Aromatoleum buckelii]